MGYELELFEHAEIVAHWQCMVCKDIPEGDHKLRMMCTNGHIVCATCIDPNQHVHVRTAKCYMCQIPISQSYTYRTYPGIERFLKNLPVVCSKKAEGCNWKGRCADLRAHESTKCEHRIVKCKLSGCSFEGLPRKVATHELTCGHRMMTCSKRLPWNLYGEKYCKIQHKVMDTEHHIQNVCKHHPCAFHAGGCRVEGTKAEVALHQASYCARIHAEIDKLKLAVQNDVLKSETARVKTAAQAAGKKLRTDLAAAKASLQLQKERKKVKKMGSQGCVASKPTVVGVHVKSRQDKPDVSVHLATQHHSQQADRDDIWPEARWDDFDGR